MSYAFATMNVAVIMVDAGARIIFANELAAPFLSRDDSLTLDGIHIGGDAPALRRLRCAIARGADATALCAAVESVAIAAPGNSAALRITIIPLGRNTIVPQLSGVGFVEPVVLLVIDDHAEQRRAMRRRLGARFGLTAAEAGVLTEVIAGGTVRDIARRLGVSVTTVRTHLGHVFDKTGVRRQSELVRFALDGEMQLARLQKKGVQAAQTNGMISNGAGVPRLVCSSWLVPTRK